MYYLKLELPGLPKTINAIGRKHWAVKVKEAQYWKSQVWVASLGKRPPKPLKMASLRFVRFSSVEPDPDGLVSSMKHLSDGLVAAGIIEDDKYSNIGMPHYEWVKVPKNQGRVVIEVTASLP